MKTYVVSVVQIETRTYTFRARSEAAAIAMAEEWNEQATGDTPEGALDYHYSFDSHTDVVSRP